MDALFLFVPGIPDFLNSDATHPLLHAQNAAAVIIRIETVAGDSSRRQFYLPRQRSKPTILLVAASTADFPCPA